MPPSSSYDFPIESRFRSHRENPQRLEEKTKPSPRERKHAPAHTANVCATTTLWHLSIVCGIQMTFTDPTQETQRAWTEFTLRRCQSQLVSDDTTAPARKNEDGKTQEKKEE